MASELSVVASEAHIDLPEREEKEQKLSKNALKRQKKQEDAAARKAQRVSQVLLGQRPVEEAKLVADPSLPEAKRMSIADAGSSIGERVKVFGWIHFLRKQGNLMFVELRDGTQTTFLLQCVLSGKLTKTHEARSLTRETTVCMMGTLVSDPRAKGKVELQVDSMEVLARSSPELETLFNEHSGVETLADQRHLVLRQLEPSLLLRLRSITLQCFREYLFDKGFIEVTPPALVQTQVEGGSTLFQVNYFGEPAYLSQSAQLYLETVVPSLAKVFSIGPSFRAEKSRTRRHLSEFTHLEGEVGFLSFEELLQILEDMVVEVSKAVQKKAPDMLRAIHPEFQVPQRPFLRMSYEDAISYCREHHIYKNEDSKEHFEFGDDIPEGPERKMTDMIGRPIFLTRFPAQMKSFYMARCPENKELTESVDCLMPGVGEIIGGSMRAWDYEELMKGYERESLDPSSYYWYNDLRKYGSCPHGGWGLGVERFLCWLLKQEHVREVCLYPRHVGRCAP